MSFAPLTTLRRDALFHISVLTLPVAAVAAAAPGSALLSVALWAGLAAAVIAGLPAHGHARFGPANALTLARAAVASVLAGLVAAEEIPAAMAAAAGLAALLADGLDGPLARRTALESRFGARFDMEVDAVLVLVLSGLAVAAEKAGAWALLLGLLRYAWAAAEALVPAFSRPLPPSDRRRACCAVAVGGLLLALALPAPFSAAVCAGALCVLIFSFGADLRLILGAPFGADRC